MQRQSIPAHNAILAYGNAAPFPAIESYRLYSDFPLAQGEIYEMGS